MSSVAAVSATLTPKQRANLVARCALLGIVLHIIEDDAGVPLFIASRWALTKQMKSVEEVEAFITLAGGRGA